MGVCSWMMQIFYESKQKQIPTALIVPPFISVFSEDYSIRMIQKHTKKWYRKREKAAIVIQREYDNTILRKLLKYYKLNKRIRFRNFLIDKADIH